MRVHVKFFAIFREMTGIKSEWIDVPDSTTVEQLWRNYAGDNPRIANIRAAYAVNQRLVKPDQLLQAGDEVGFLPPVSGGAPRPARRKTTRSQQRKAVGKDVFVTRRRLDPAELVKRVAFSGAGAILTFSGVVRDNANDKSVDHLEYDAYPEMAEATMEQIRGEIAQRWPLVHIVMAHRVGRLKIGEASLIIAVAAPHRAEAYAASRYALERIKATLPVWKKEFAADGDYWVEGPVAGEVASKAAEEIVQAAERAATK